MTWKGRLSCATSKRAFPCWRCNILEVGAAVRVEGERRAVSQGDTTDFADLGLDHIGVITGLRHGKGLLGILTGIDRFCDEPGDGADKEAQYRHRSGQPPRPIAAVRRYRTEIKFHSLAKAVDLANSGISGAVCRAGG